MTDKQNVTVTFLLKYWHYEEYLRNKFHFSDIHQSMNAVGRMQSKWRPKVNFACDPLHSYFDECQKIYIHLLYLHYFRIISIN